MIVAAPTWFTDEYLGIEVEQYIGFGLLAVIATLVHFALLRVIAIWSVVDIAVKIWRFGKLSDGD